MNKIARQAVIIIATLTYSSFIFGQVRGDEVLDLRSDLELVKEYWELDGWPNPKYPSSTLRLEITYCVLYSVTITNQSEPSNIQLESSHPKGKYLGITERALKKYRWKATEANKTLQPVRVYVMFWLSFNDGEIKCT